MLNLVLFVESSCPSETCPLMVWLEQNSTTSTLLPQDVHLQLCMTGAVQAAKETAKRSCMEWHGEGWKLLFMVPSNTRMRGTRWSQKIADSNESQGSRAHSAEGCGNPCQSALEVLKGCIGLKSSGTYLWQKNPTRAPDYKHTTWEFLAEGSF